MDLNPTRGDEMKKTRPCLVISIDGISRLNLAIVIPITEWQESFKKQPWKIPVSASAVSGLHKNSALDTFQIKSLSTERFVQKRGELDGQTIKEAASAVALVVGYEP